MRRRTLGLFLCIALVGSASVLADDTFDKLFKAQKYKEAINYADDNLSPATRPADVWVKIAQANEKLGLVEKALACFLVSSRLNPKDYSSWLGAARIYNQMGDYDNGLTYAKKALDLNFSGEASWQYASACIKLKRSAEAKKALEKVIETDPSNAIANRELGNIYYTDKEYAKAIPLLRKSYEKKADGEVAYRIGKAGLETNDLSTAIEFLKNAAKSSPQALLDLARTYYKKGDYTNASSAYDKVLGKTQDTPEDYYSNAVAKEKAGDTKGALKAYVAAVREYKGAKTREALAARLIVARDQLKTKQYQQALGHFKFILTADPNRSVAPDIYFLLADAYEGLKKFSDAISNLEKALKIDSKNVEAYARLADLYKRAGMESKAKATYEKMISLSPNDPNIYLILGEYNRKVKNYPTALKHFKKSFVLGRSAKAAEGIAVSAAALKQWDEAGDAAESAVSLDPGLMEPRIVLYQFYIKKGNYPSATKQLEVLVEQDKNNLEYWQKLALSYSKTGSTQKLAQADKKVISLDKKDKDSRHRFAEYSLSKKDNETAQKLYFELATLDPKNPKVFKNLYLIAKAKGEKVSALSNVTKYLALNPNDAEAQRDKGDYLYEKKKLDGALNAYRQALKIDPQIKGFLKRYAEIVIAKGQHDEAIKALNLKVNAGNANADDHATLGMIYQKKKSYTSAIKAYQKSLQLNPQNVEILTALAETQALKGEINEAIITYEQVLMMNPKAGAEFKALGNLYTKQKKTDQAMKAYRNYLDNVKKDNAVAMKVGRHLLSKKQYADAIKYLQMVEGKEASSFDFLGDMAEASFYAKNYKKCVELCQSLLGRSPSATSRKKISLLLAQAYENDGQMIQAADAYKQYVAIKGVYDSEAAYKAAFLREKKDKAGAAKIYQSNVTKYSKDYRNFLQLGLIYSDSKATLSKSISMFKKITTLADSIPLIWMKLGEVYGKLGKSDQELAAYKNFIKHEPQDPQANKRIGIILIRNSKYKEGLIYLETASTLAPKDPEILYTLALGYDKTSRPEESVRALEKAMSIDSKNPKIISALYKLYMKVGRSKEAKKMIEQLISMNPNDAATRLTYAEVLYDEGKYREAEEEVENVMATSPSNEALMMMGAVKTAQKQYKEALGVYDEIISMENHAGALYQKAELFRLYGRQLKKSPKWAETFYERALRADPKYGLAKLGLARLQKLWKRDDLYRKLVKEAYGLDPSNPEILAEHRNLK